MSIPIYHKYLRITCKEASFLISKRQEISLTWAERIRLRFHLSICGPCTRFAKQVALLEASLADYFKSPNQKPQQFSPDKKAALEKLINDHK